MRNHPIEENTNVTICIGRRVLEYVDSLLCQGAGENHAQNRGWMLPGAGFCFFVLASSSIRTYHNPYAYGYK
jgi:hypothetical protein